MPGKVERVSEPYSVPKNVLESYCKKRGLFFVPGLNFESGVGYFVGGFDRWHLIDVGKSPNDLLYPVLFGGSLREGGKLVSHRVFASSVASRIRRVLSGFEEPKTDRERVLFTGGTGNGLLFGTSRFRSFRHSRVLYGNKSFVRVERGKNEFVDLHEFDDAAVSLEGILKRFPEGQVVQASESHFVEIASRDPLVVRVVEHSPFVGRHAHQIGVLEYSPEHRFCSGLLYVNPLKKHFFRTPVDGISGDIPGLVGVLSEFFGRRLSEDAVVSKWPAFAFERHPKKKKTGVEWFAEKTLKEYCEKRRKGLFELSSVPARLRRQNIVGSDALSHLTYRYSYLLHRVAMLVRAKKAADFIARHGV